MQLKLKLATKSGMNGSCAQSSAHVTQPVDESKIQLQAVSA